MSLVILTRLTVLLSFLSAHAADASLQTGSQAASDVRLANSTDGKTTVLLTESVDAVRIRVTGPAHILPSIAIDGDRNGRVDPDTDFKIASTLEGGSCLSVLLTESKSLPCQAPGAKALITKKQNGEQVTSDFLLPKQAISADGFGFGYAVELWNQKESFGTTIASGEYRFGGYLKSNQGQNFLGKTVSISDEVTPLRRYQGCVNRALEAIGILQPSKLAQLQAVKPGCAAERQTGMTKAIDALVKSGSSPDDASREIADVLAQYDAELDRMIASVVPPRSTKSNSSR